jgi:hypothetical protein
MGFAITLKINVAKSKFRMAILPPFLGRINFNYKRKVVQQKTVILIRLSTVD